jgi:protein O-mannosyl-transferase
MTKRNQRAASLQRNQAASSTSRAPSAISKPAASATGPLDLGICLALLLLTLAVYSRAVHFEFINFDDPEYVTGNPHIRAGLTWAGLRWAFASYYASNWSPITWLSHMADCQFFGLRSGWHHSTNIVIHAAAAALLFAALKRLTGARWPSALAALLFALHPLHVESVAWISERKDVLCALFWFLALWCYARYAERPGAVRYGLVLLTFGLGLMAKGMIVTLPFTLLLLDYWPLRRADRPGVLLEKVPFLTLAAAVAVVTFFAQGHAVRSLASVPIGMRVENALITYVAYILRMFWPTHLAVFYPYPSELPAWQVAAAGIALLGVTVLVALRARSYPYLAVGWLWYLGTLVPVIGLVQVGSQASADRYTYVPMVGLAIMLGWGGADLVRRLPRARTAIAAAAVTACSACVLLTWLQLRYWTDSESLFRHAAEVTGDNYIAQNSLSSYYLVRGRTAEALEHVYETLRIRQAYPEAHTNLALALMRLGRLDESEREYRLTLGLKPESVEAHSGYGALLLAEGRTQEGLREFSEAVALRPDYATGHFDMGRVLAAMGRADEAIGQFHEAVRLQPDHAEARHSLGVALLSRGRLDEALVQFRAEARLKPDDAGAHYQAATLLASAGRFDEAIAEFSEALRIDPGLDAARRGLETARQHLGQPRQR